MSPGALIIALLSIATSTEATISQQQQDDWFNDKSASAVNEGTLTFLPSPPAKAVHHHQNRIRITATSLTDGWVQLEQCHANLDAVPAAQIAFRNNTVRKLRIVEARAITQAWVEGSSVQLAGVSPGARLCLTAQTLALKNSGGGDYTLNNGPYLRKFLDGYYPMQVSLQLNYPPHLLQLTSVSPTHQPGFQISQKKGFINIETLFEGELHVRVQFKKLN